MATLSPLELQFDATVDPAVPVPTTIKSYTVPLSNYYSILNNSKKANSFKSIRALISLLLILPIFSSSSADIYLQLWVQKNLNVVFDSLLKISYRENGLSILCYINRTCIHNVSKQIEKNGESVTITPFYERTNIVKQVSRLVHGEINVDI